MALTNSVEAEHNRILPIRFVIMKIPPFLVLEKLWALRRSGLKKMSRE
jgi:hypothetical protein